MKPDIAAGTPLVRDALARPQLMLIDGLWSRAASGKVMAVENPATAEQISEVAVADAADVDRAVASARRTFASRVWRGLSADRRAEHLTRLADLIMADEVRLSHLEVLDNGMPLRQAQGLVAYAAQSFRYVAGLCPEIFGRAQPVGADFEMHAYTVHEPVGVAALITPWNGPLAAAANKLAAALAAGCSVVLKPSELTCLTALRLGELALEAGIPEGVVNVVTGAGEVGRALVEHPDVNSVSFTGSTAVGKEIVRGAAGNLKRVTLELGGKSPVFVFDDADLEAAIPQIALGIFTNSGQMCYAGSRLYAQAGIYQKLMDGLVEFASGLVVGDGFDARTNLGPLISRRQLDRVLGYVASGRSAGADVAVGGASLERDGWFMQPTILTGVRPDMQVCADEIFGPVLCVSRFETMQDLERLGNDTEYGLAAGIYTRDVAQVHVAARLLEAGTVWVNCYNRQHPSMPFGGFKQSGWGREHGRYGIGTFLEEKTVYIKL